MAYSKYGQYTYFMWGIHSRFSPIKKFLEQEFKDHHDQHNNIPISLELHNLPETISSLARIHGIPITLSTDKVQQVADTHGDSNSITCMGDNDPLLALDSIQQIPSTTMMKQPSSPSSLVQCWLCDGPHTFRDCKELKRLHTVCAKRPNLSKYVTKLIKNARDDNTRKVSIKVILDT
jgi:hypothetical protein